MMTPTCTACFHHKPMLKSKQRQKIARNPSQTCALATSHSSAEENGQGSIQPAAYLVPMPWLGEKAMSSVFVSSGLDYAAVQRQSKHTLSNWSSSKDLALRVFILCKTWESCFVISRESSVLVKMLASREGPPYRVQLWKLDHRLRGHRHSHMVFLCGPGMSS